MNIETLENIRIIENDHILEVLIMDESLNISMNALLAVRNIGNITIVVSTPIAASSIVSKVCGLKNYKVVLPSQIPMKKYDILLSNTTSELLKIITAKLRIKYLCFFNYIEKGFPGPDYYEFEKLCFKLKSQQHKEQPVKQQTKVQETQQLKIKEEPAQQIEDIEENDSANYEMIIKDIGSFDMVYDKYSINYMNEMIPGMTSIIFIVSERNNKFAETLRALKSQNVALVEYIIIDNNSGYRNNVPPNIRYFQTMPKELCIFHAKELCSGEYMIILDQDADEFDIVSMIHNGKYETR